MSNNLFAKLAMGFIVALMTSFPCIASAATGNWYSSVEECRERAEGGQVIQYIPAPNQARAKRATDSGAIIAPLQVSVCVEMRVIDGNFHAVYVPQGTEMLWKNDQLYGHATCGNEIRGEILEIAQAQVAVQGPAGPQGEQGEQGPPGRDGRDGVTEVINRYVPAPPQGGTTSGYSGLEYARDLGWQGVTAFGVHEARKYFEHRSDNKVRVAQINAARDVRVAEWDSRRGPSQLTVNQVGDCNAAFNSSTNCQRTTNNTTNTAPPSTQPPQVIREVVHVDRLIPVPFPVTGGGGPLYNAPAEPGPGYNQPAEPFGGGGLVYNQPVGPTGGGGLGEPSGGANPNYSLPAGPQQCSAPPC